MSTCIWTQALSNQKMANTVDEGDRQEVIHGFAAWVQLLCAVLLLSISAFVISGHCEEIALQEEETSQSLSSTVWTLEDILDDFDDPTGEQDIKSVVLGHYSSIQVSEGEAEVIVRYYPKHYVFGFQLLEKKEKKILFDESTQALLKIKVDDSITEYDLMTEPPYDSLYLSGEWQWDGFDEIRNLLLTGKDVRCVILFDGIKYNFTVSSEGYGEILEPFNQRVYKVAMDEYNMGNFFIAKYYFKRLGAYKDAQQMAVSCEDKTLQKEDVQTEAEMEEISEIVGESATEEGFMVFASDGSLRYDARVEDGQVVGLDGIQIPGCILNDDGFVVDAYGNIIDPMTGEVPQ